MLDRLVNDVHFDMAHRKHEAKWGEANYKFTPSKVNPKCTKFNVEYPNVFSIEDEAKQRKDFRRAFEHEQYLRRQDIELLFKTMSKYVEGWWD